MRTALRNLLDGNPLLLGVAAIGFSVSYQTVAALAARHGLPGWPPLYPAGVDLGIAALIIESRHLIRLGRSDLAPRLLAWLLTGFTIYANVHGSLPHDWVGRGLHAVMPCLWVACLELTRRRMIAAEVRRREGVPLARWLLAPASTFAIYRRMVLWQVTSYALALEREQLRRRTIAILKARHGGEWTALADSSVVWQLRHGIDVEGAAAAVAGLPAVAPAAPPASALAGPSADATAGPPAVPAATALAAASAAPPAAATDGATASAVARVRRRGSGRSTDDEIRAAIRELRKDDPELTKYGIQKALRGSKGTTGTERAGRLLAQVQAERPSLQAVAAS